MEINNISIKFVINLQQYILGINRPVFCSGRVLSDLQQWSNKEVTDKEVPTSRHPCHAMLIYQPHWTLVTRLFIDVPYV